MSGVKRKNGPRKMREAMEKASNEQLVQVMRKTAIDLFGAIILATPVKEGRARGSWGAGLNRPAPGPHNRKDPSGSQAQADVMLALANFKAGDKITLSSSLEYIVPLERGHSWRQAPNGMVSANVVRFGPILSAAAREIRRRG